MAPVRVVMLCVALTAAIGAGLIVRGMAKGQAQPAPAAAPATAAVVQEPMTEVLIAKRDLPPGTTLVADDMGWQAWPEASLNNQFITKTSAAKADEDSPVVKLASETGERVKEAVAGPGGPIAELTGTVVREPILAGEPLTRRKLVRAGSAGIMSITLRPGMRGIAVPLSAETAAGGFILPGDHVDVVQSRELEGDGGGGKRFATETVLTNVKVLAIDQATGSKDAAVVGATATLELSPLQAESLVLARSQGQLTLILRSYADIDGPTETALRGDVGGSGLKTSVVRVFRNGQPNEVTVNR